MCIFMRFWSIKITTNKTLKSSISLNKLNQTYMQILFFVKIIRASLWRSILMDMRLANGSHVLYRFTKLYKVVTHFLIVVKPV